MQQVSSWLSNGSNVVLVVLGLGLIVFLHELGHFLMAKKNKVRVEIFSLGFGQALFKFRRGETEYRIAWLPLGGYVKMAGETLSDERTGEPFELTSKTPWQRFEIFVAGALMNLLIAFPIAILSYVIGKCEVPNEIGRPGIAEERAGIRPGDVILEVAGRKIDSLEKLRIEMIRHPNGTRVPVRLRRMVQKGSEKVPEERTVEVECMRSSAHESFAPSTMLVAPVEGSPLYGQGVRYQDEITSVNGEDVYMREEADERLRKCVDQEVRIGIRHRDPSFENDDKIRTVIVRLPKKTWYVIPMDEGVLEARVSVVHDGSAAAGLLKPDDVIQEINKQPIGSWSQMRTIVEKSVDKSGEKPRGIPIELGVRRDGDTLTVSITPHVVDGHGQLGIERNDRKGSVFGYVRPNSFYARMGLQSGDRLVEIDGHGGDVTFDGVPDKVPAVWGVREEEPRTIPIKVDRKGDRLPINLVLEPKDEGDLAAAGFQTFKTGWLKGQLIAGGSLPFRRRPFGDAVKVGLAEPVDITVLTLDILKKVVTGGESPKGFSGPIGIMQASYQFAQRAFGNFLWLMCLITVNLGIFNLLPIPILDGGHNVLLLIEVVRKWFGKPPPSERFIAGFQYVGLAFILSLFVFVTYNDISRLIGHG